MSTIVVIHQQPTSKLQLSGADPRKSTITGVGVISGFIGQFVFD